MSDDTRVIMGKITRPDDTPVVGAKVYFTLSSGDAMASGGAVVVRMPVSILTNDSGDFSIKLKRNDGAFSDTHYAVSVGYSYLGREIVDQLGSMQVLDDDVVQLDFLLARDLIVGRGVDDVVLGAALDAMGARDEARDLAASVDPDAIKEDAVGLALGQAPFLNVLKNAAMNERDENGNFVAPFGFYNSENTANLHSMTVFAGDDPAVPEGISFTGAKRFGKPMNVCRVEVSGPDDHHSTFILLGGLAFLGDVTSGATIIFAETAGFTVGGSDLDAGTELLNFGRYRRGGGNADGLSMGVKGGGRVIWISMPFVVAGELPEGQRATTFLGSGLHTGD